MAWLSVCWGLTLCLTTTTTTNSATTSDTTTAVNTGARRADVQARLDDSSSRPVAPIEPLMDLGGRGAAPPGPLQPVFDEAAPRSVSSLSGGTAYLHCVVHHLGGGSVSWIRRRDLHILTVGTYTYTTDQRFEVVHAAPSRDWILKLRYAQERDSGLYDCQVSRRPVLTYSPPPVPASWAPQTCTWTEAPPSTSPAPSPTPRSLPPTSFGTTTARW
ncbi:hypothetical protein O3P69_010776 [Scylla paramamosain]|uniref:Ig-like domain-containing protein n=1 Tax=Scylla paramamosain TaxID=85552 RepID=A0AAW0TI72_SCYPA